MNQLKGPANSRPMCQVTYSQLSESTQQARGNTFDGCRKRASWDVGGQFLCTSHTTTVSRERLK